MSMEDQRKILDTEQIIAAGFSDSTPSLKEQKEIALEELATHRLFPEQQFVYDSIIESTSLSTGPIAVYGAAGTGKSFLLKSLYNAYLLSDIVPVILAPTGVAAHTIKGLTLHRFFGITPHGSINLVRLEQFMKVYKRVVFLVDEVSMISRDFINALDNALQPL